MNTLSIHEIFKNTRTVFHNNLKIIVLVALVLIAIPTFIIELFLSYAFPTNEHVALLPAEAAADFSWPAAIASFVLGIVNFGLYAIALAALVFITLTDAQGEEPQLGSSAKQAVEVSIPVLLLMAVTGLALGVLLALTAIPLGLVASFLGSVGIPPFVFMLLVGAPILFAVMGTAVATWCVNAPVRIVEGTSLIDAFRRSGLLTQGNRWRIASAFVLVWLALAFAWLTVTVFTGGITDQAVARLMTGSIHHPATVLLALLSGISAWVTVSINSVMIAVIYVMLRNLEDSSGPLASARFDPVGST